MYTRTPLIASALLAASLISGAAHAALQGRDLNGSIDSFEAYYDTDLNITWLADANVNGAMTWEAANTWAANLSFTDGVNIYDNWRLPIVAPVNGTGFNLEVTFNGSTDVGANISEQGTAFAGSTGSEMAHLFYNTLDNKSVCDPGYSNPWECSGDLARSELWKLNNPGPFTNLQTTWGDNRYWSATEFVLDTSTAWNFDFHSGAQLINDKHGADGAFYALAVTPGDVAAIPEASTYAMMLAGLGLVGAMERRRKIAKA